MNSVYYDLRMNSIYYDLTRNSIYYNLTRNSVNDIMENDLKMKVSI